MNVVISNKQRDALANLDIEVIKKLDGEYSIDEIIEIFQNFFFNRMIIDITALKNYEDIKTIQRLSISFDMNKVILLLDSASDRTTPEYLSKLISMGIYNFTTDVGGIIYLYNNPNSYRDVAQYHRLDNLIMDEQEKVDNSNLTDDFSENNESVDNALVNPAIVDTYDDSRNTNKEVKGKSFKYVSNVEDSSNKKHIVGLKSVTPGAGSTTLIYLMKKHLEKYYNVLAMEVEKRDFIYFRDNSMISVSNSNVDDTLKMNNDKNIILVDLNGSPTAEKFCTDVLYLIEPSIIKINRLLAIKPKILNELQNKKVILVPSLLSNKDVKDFEYESRLKIFYNLPPVDDHAKSEEINKLLAKMGFIKIK